MMMYKQWMLAALAGWLSASAVAGEIRVTDAWARPTVPAQAVGAAYLTLTSSSDAQLLKAESPVAQTVELHTMSMNNGVMQMRAIQSLPLPAGKPVMLMPGGNHIMLIDLKQPLKVGERVPLQLTVQEGSSKPQVLKVEAEVRQPTGNAGHQHHH